MLPRGLERTFRTLLGSTNPAATEVLVAALNAEPAHVRRGALRALALRTDRAGHAALVSRFAELGPDDRAVLTTLPAAAALRGSLGRLVVEAQPSATKRPIEVAACLDELSALPAIVDVARSGEHPAGAAAAAATLRLARVLWDRLATRPADQPDPAFVRRPVINALARAIDEFARHKRPELVDAFLFVAPHDEGALVRVLQNAGHPARGALCDSLQSGKEEGAIALLAAVMRDLTSPDDLLRVATQRLDAPSLDGLYRRLGSPLGARVVENAARVETLPWLVEERRGVLLALSPEAQASAIEFAAATKASRVDAAAACALLIEKGSDAGRVAAVRALAGLPTSLTAEPLRKAVRDPCPDVARLAVGLLRQKNVPDATRLLIGLLDDEQATVRETAQRSLRELSYSAYRDHYHELTPDQRRRAGALVAKADPLAMAALQAELTSGAVERRLRGLELIEAMGVADRLWQVLVVLLADRDAGVRAEAARLLGGTTARGEVLDALRKHGRDRSSAVRTAVERAIALLGSQPVTMAPVGGRA
ncbi:MAG: HEAT repeat domain-containing protein [Lacipirellulaceae bacterium]